MEDKIRRLCALLITEQDPKKLSSIVVELRSTLHQYIERSRKHIVDLRKKLSAPNVSDHRALEPTTTDPGLGGVMTLAIEYIGDLMVIECKGRIVQSEAALNLRDAVMSQQNVQTILLDLAGVSAIEGGGLGMLWFLQLWAENHGIELKLFNATDSVNDALHLIETATFRFNMATFEDAMALVERAESRHIKAA